MAQIDKSIQDYKKMVNKHHPQESKLKNFFLAYLFGGSICLVGQIINNLFVFFNFNPTQAGTLTTIVLILIGGLLTGLGIYDELAQIAGAGTIVPITGFANAVVSPALEYKQEGYILGTGTQVYSIVGPVLTYGMLTAMLVGILKLLII
ncbi:stage V sporulation protein AC [Halanaerobacter jeridensis]|uniref:Stage V sporulation protein AC n=1 Tax=Halanaerobacter jeridensis TaxID=706427 RepID=A0A938XU35_9FIRM|nr:stage V sporulation protein AC [Halanaerobacter jeridensis]MBM7555270.1 stage V sporulation protein AC [Halanaerobacter jeridensis]